MSSTRTPTSGRPDRGASAVEYALVLAGIAAVIVAVVVLLGGNTLDLYDRACDAARQATGTGSCS